MKTHGSSFTLHVVAGALVAAALLTVATAAAAASPSPVTSDSFAPDWQSHAQNLILLGGSNRVGTQPWMVPGILPRGRYVLINREGDKAELMNGYQFQVLSGAGAKIKLLLPVGYNNVEALPVGDVAATNVPRTDELPGAL